MNHPNHIALLALTVLALSGCAGTPKPLPEAITTAPSGDLQLVEVARDPERFSGALVRWGGTVLSVNGVSDGAYHIEVVGRTLNRDGKPRLGGGSDGRFVIFAPTSKDADEYRTGDLITVAGTVAGSAEGRIGEQSATFPLIHVTDHYRWREDPYADYPYYPYGRWRFGLGYGTGSHYHFGAHHGFGYYPWGRGYHGRYGWGHRYRH